MNFLLNMANMVTGMMLDVDYDFPERLEFLIPILNALNMILGPILIVVGTAGTIYAVVLGVSMAKAENAQKREEAKKRIINAVVAIVITIVLILLFNLFIANVDTFIA